MEQTITIQSLGDFVRSLSGLFMSKTNAHGISPKEIKIITCFLFLLAKNNTRTVTKEIKIEAANELNQSLQVTINYLTKLRAKGIIGKDNKFHPLFYKQSVTIKYNGQINM